MKAIEIAWKEFFKQFAPYVFHEGEFIDDPNNALYPRITFSYSVGDFFDETLTTFQVWDWAHNSDLLWQVCEGIAKAVPAQSGATIVIPGETYFEYLNPDTGQWDSFEIGGLQAIADKFAPLPIEWHKVEEESAGGIEIRRGTPFLTPSPKDEPLSRAMYGTLASRYLNII